MHLQLDSRPESLTLVRAMLSGAGQLFGLPDEVLDDLRTAVSEACSNVVLHAYDDQLGPLLVDVDLGAGGVYATVLDHGHGIRAITSSGDRMRIGLVLISALADRTQVLRGSTGGTEVRMAFALATGPDQAADWPLAAPSLLEAMRGDVVAFVTPVEVLEAVLGRVSNAFATRAHFSIDRHADIDLVADEISAHVKRSAFTDGIGFTLVAHDRRLELTIGPLQTGSSARLRAPEPRSGEISRLQRLTDELIVEIGGESETLRIRLDAEPTGASA